MFFTQVGPATSNAHIGRLLLAVTDSLGNMLPTKYLDICHWAIMNHELWSLPTKDTMLSSTWRWHPHTSEIIVGYSRRKHVEGNLWDGSLLLVVPAGRKWEIYSVSWKALKFETWTVKNIMAYNHLNSSQLMHFILFRLFRIFILTKLLGFFMFFQAIFPSTVSCLSWTSPVTAILLSLRSFSQDQGSNLASGWKNP